MIFARRKLGPILFSFALLAACGSPGVPLPPSLELARPVSNLRAARKGGKVILTWSAPTETTDQHNIRHPGATGICRALQIMKECGTPIAQLPSQQKSAKRTQSTSLQTYSDEIPANLQVENPFANLFYAVVVQNSYGRNAGISNQAEVLAAPTLAPPANLQAQVTADGIRLTWNPVASPPEISGLRFVYRVYRHEEGRNHETLVGELPVENQPSPEIVDRSFEWEKSYEYRLAIVTFVAQANGQHEVEGDDTPAVTVFAHDVFPPATPTGLQAVFSGPGQKPFIDLVWTPDTEADLAGYNVYRHEQGTNPVKINSDVLKSPSLRDSEVVPGHTYFYSVSAIDVRGNESAPSEEASETVPPQ